MKLQTRLTLVISAIFLIGWMIAGVAAYTVEQRNARQETIRTAEILIDTATAARWYTTVEIEPLLSQQTTKETFLRQTVPSYAAQRIFSRFTEKYPKYVYAERALNPTNPQDLAEGWQVEIIQNFIRNRDLTQIVSTRKDLNNREYLYVAEPVIIETEKCLKCHSVPEVAPPAQIKTYGDINGFGWQLNEVVGARLISVPTEVPQKQARETILSYCLLIASIFLIAYTVVIIIVRRWILRPLDRIAHTLEEISLRKTEKSRLPQEGTDEFGGLIKSINRLLVSLNKYVAK